MLSFFVLLVKAILGSFLIYVLIGLAAVILSSIWMRLNLQIVIRYFLGFKMLTFFFYTYLYLFWSTFLYNLTLVYKEEFPFLSYFICFVIISISISEIHKKRTVLREEILEFNSSLSINPLDLSVLSKQIFLLGYVSSVILAISYPIFAVFKINLTLMFGNLPNLMSKVLLF